MEEEDADSEEVQTDPSSSQPQIFIKRSGTTDVGKLYEDLFMSNLILDLVIDDEVKDFRISGNNVTFGSFDDVVAEIDWIDRTQHVAFQLKHNNDPLTAQGLKADKGKFSLPKYSQDMKKFKAKLKENIDSFQWILFTNRPCKFKPNIKVQFLDETYVVNEVPSATLPIKYCSNGRGFTFVAESGPDEFFDKFVLCTDQPNVTIIKNDIYKKLREKFYCEDEVSEKYLQWISSWSFQEGTKEKLNKFVMQQVIVACLLAPFVVLVLPSAGNYPEVDLLQKAINEFRVTLLNTESVDTLKLIFGQILDFFKNSETHLEEIEATRKKFRSLEDENFLRDDELSVILWHMDKSPLIVNEDRSSVELVKFCKNKKFVIITVNQSVRNELGEESTLETLDDLKKNPALHREILNQFRCSLQGRSPILLEELIQVDGQIEKIITINELIRVLHGPVLIGEEKEELPEIFFSRLLSRLLINPTFLSAKEKETIVIICGFTNVVFFQEAIPNINLVEIEEIQQTFDPKCIYVTEDEYGAEKFNEFCKQMDANKYHQFRIVQDQYLEWVRSSAGTSDLTEFCIKDQFIEELQLMQDVSEDNLQVLTDDAGMGKTVFAKNLKNNYPSTYWPILIFPKDHAKYFRKKESDIEKFEQYIIPDIVKRMHYTHFESKIFEIFVKNRKIVYIWDALDEASTKNQTTVLSLIDKLSQQGSKQWVTSRKNLKTVLEYELNILTRTIRAFDEEEQRKYIQKRFQCSENEVSEIFGKISRNIQLFRYNNILGIPLQIYMLTEILIQNREEYEARLNSIFSLTDLYKKFVKEKFNVYLKKMGVSVDTDDLAYESNKEIKRLRIANYEKVALNIYLPREVVQNLQNSDCEEFLEQIRKKKDLYGIITEVTDDLIPSFWHNSYGEYFTASYLSKNFKKFSNMSDFIFQSRYDNIRFMFDLMLAKNCRAHVAVLYKNLKVLRDCQGKDLKMRDKGKRNPLQVACSWGEKYPIFKVVCKDLDAVDKRFIMDEPPIIKDIPENEEHRQILEYLSDKYDPQEKEEVYSFSAISYADSAQCLLSLEVLSAKQTLEFCDFKHFNDMVITSFYSIQYNFANVLDSIQTVPSIDIRSWFHDNPSLLSWVVYNGKSTALRKLMSQENFTKELQEKKAELFYRACEDGHTDVVKVLLENGADVNQVNEEDLLPLYTACYNGHSAVLKLLIQEGADVNVKDKGGDLPIHCACNHSGRDIVQLLIDKDADINRPNSEGDRPIHLACQAGQHEVVKLLIEKGADVNCPRGKSGSNLPIHIACRNGRYETVKILIEAGIDPSVADQWTHDLPMHYACREGNIEIVKLLLESGSKINAANKRAEQPLKLAFKGGHHEVVQLLLDEDAVRDALYEEVYDYGHLPIHFACLNGYYGIVEILLKLGVDINVPDQRHEDLPIHYACQGGHREIVKLLIENGADFNNVNNRCKTPLDLAGKNNKIIALLEVYGATRGWQKGLIVGIHFGIDRSQISLYVNQKIRKLMFADVSSFIRTMLVFGEADEITIGERYKRKKQQSTIYDFQLLIGKNSEDPWIRRILKHLKFDVDHSSDEPMILIPQQNDIPLRKTPKELTELFLQKLKDNIDSELNVNAENAVITVPGFFNGTQKRAIEAAAIEAGFTFLKLLDEPVAAGLSHHYLRKDSRTKLLSLIYLFEREGFSFALVKRKDESFDVLCVEGDEQLGIECLINAMVDYVCEQLKLIHGYDPNLETLGLRLLYKECKRVAIDMLYHGKQTLILKRLVPGQEIVKLDLIYEQFEKNKGEMFQKMMKMLDGSLKKSQVSKRDIDEVICGSQRNVLELQQFLCDYFGEDTAYSFNGEEYYTNHVANGAALYAATFSSNPKQKSMEIRLNVIDS